MDEAFIAHITKVNGDLTRWLARRRELLAQISTVDTDSRPLVPITVRSAQTFEMKVPPQMLHSTLEVELAETERQLRALAALPLDWIPQQPVAALPQATEPAPPPFPDEPTTTGEPSNV